MLRPPRNRGDRLLTLGLLVRAYLFLGSLEAAAAMGAFMLVLGGAGGIVALHCPPMMCCIVRRPPRA